MQLPDPYAFTTIEAVPDVPAGARLEQFCSRIAHHYDGYSWTTLTAEGLIEGIAEEFRRHFLLTVPVRPQLNGLLCALDVEVVRHDEDDFAVTVDVAGKDGPWQIHQPERLGLRQSYATLKALFEILFWRGCYRIEWWNTWRECAQITHPRRLAERFAYAVMLPAGEFRDWALSCHLDIWRLSDALQVTPSACFYGLRRFVRLPYPYFLARLQFDVELDQQQLFFEDGAVRAQVWSKFLARPEGALMGEPTALDGLQKFARQGAIVEATGFLYQAIKRRQPQLWTARKIMGLSLGQKAVFAARPNRAGTQLLLQAVPLGAHPILMDTALRLQQEQARQAA